jgi:glycosyltransferase involved in cell wall biosynthesis
VSAAEKKILLSCHEAPYYGGAATLQYLLFELLQKSGFYAHYLTLASKTEVEIYESNLGINWWNPAKLDNVHLYISQNFNRREYSELVEIVREVNPNLIIGKNDIAPRILKNIMPESEVWFLSSCSKQMKKAYTGGYVKSLSDGMSKLREWNGKIPLTSLKEKQAVRLCDRIIYDSEATKLCFEHFYPQHIGKMFDFIFWSAPLFKSKFRYEIKQRKDFSSRSIDLLFIASNWKRVEKQYDMVKEITKQFKHLNIHILGLCRDRVSGVRYHGLIGYSEVLKLMQDSKALVSTSLYDSSPNILFEASLLGCNIVASKNCGNWRLCHPDLLVEPHNLGNFVEKSRRSLERKFDDNMNYFLNNDPLDQFISLIDRTI